MTATIDTSPEALLAVSDDSRCDIDPQDIDGDTPHHLQWCHDVVVLLRALASEKSAWTAREATAAREAVARWMIARGHVTGHGDTVEDLLAELVAGLVRERDEARAETAGWQDTAALHCRNEEYYRSLVQRIGKLYGDAAYISDDGSRQQDILCAKVPELAEQAKADAAAMRAIFTALLNNLERIPYRDIAGLRATSTPIFEDAKAALSSTAGRDLLARMERLRSALVKLHHVVTCHVIEYTNARALRDAVAGAKAALADQQGEKT